MEGAAAYLGAMIDGEGHVRVRPSHNISISNTDYDIIEAVVECCATLGLRFRIQPWSENRRRNSKTRKPVWEVFIRGKDSLELVQEIVPIRSRRKQAALGEAIAAFRKSPRPSREWLEQKYVFEGLSMQAVAEAWGKKTAASCLQWLRYYGIPSRSLSEAAKARPLETRLRRKEN